MTKKNLKLMVTEIFEVKIGCAPDIMKEVFEIDHWNYNFHFDFLVKQCNIRWIYYITETVSFICPKTSDNLPNSAVIYPCRLWKTHSTCRIPLTISFKGSLQNSVKLAIKVLIWLLLLCVINLPTHLIFAYYVWSNIRSITKILVLIFTLIFVVIYDCIVYICFANDCSLLLVVGK